MIFPFPFLYFSPRIAVLSKVLLTSYSYGKGDFHLSTNFVFNFILTFFISVSIPEHDEADDISGRYYTADSLCCRLLFLDCQLKIYEVSLYEYFL